MSRKISASAEIAVPPAQGRESIVAFNVGSDGELLLLSALRPLDYRLERAGATFPKISPDSPQDYCVQVVWENREVQDILLPSQPVNFHHVALVGDELLLACAASRRRGPEDFDLNGWLYSLDGTLVRKILLGDGIESLQATRSGEIWVAYFDEGIFGNRGWTEPIGRNGIVAWNREGARLYEFEPPAGFQGISDCYAMNVRYDNETWCYYYTSFPLVRIQDHKASSAWNTPTRGARALAIAGDYVLLAGSYDQRNEIYRLKLDANEQARIAGTFDLIDRDGNTVPLDRVVGRGSKLYVLAGDTVYVIDVNDVMSQHPRSKDRRKPGSGNV